MFKRLIGYVKELNFLGEVVNINFATKNYTLDDDNRVITFGFDGVEILKEAFKLCDSVVYDKDVLSDVNGDMYLVELHKDGDVILYYVNNKYEVTGTNGRYTINKETLKHFENTLSLVGNVYLLKNELPKEPEFNVQVVKDFDGNNFTYFYALNNKEDKEIDLIEVDTFIKDVKYERITVSYEYYNDSIYKGILNEVSLDELKNYFTGVTYVNEEVKETCGVNCGCKHFCKQEIIEKDGYDEANDIFEIFSKVGNDSPVEPEKCEKCGSASNDCYCATWE